MILVLIINYLSSMLRITLLGVLFFLPCAAGAQHEGHAAHGAPATSVLTPLAPSRAKTDSAVIADSLSRACKPRVRISVDAYTTCLGAGLSAMSSRGNVALALSTLDLIVSRDRSLISFGHPLAHALGYAVTSNLNTVSPLLAQCDERYQAGCAHGILQRYFDGQSGTSISDASLRAPCAGFRGKPELFRLFDCLHGTGHGLMMYHRYEPVPALEGCDRFAAMWERQSCYGGVFMEYNSMARLRSLGDATHGMHKHAAPKAGVVLFKPDDLHHPCSATGVKYRFACYDLQADLILPAVKQDFAKASRVCDAAGELVFVRACHAGLGRNAAGAAGFNVSGIRERCDKSSAEGLAYCYQGAVRQLSYGPTEVPRGFAFCGSLPEGELRTRCWSGLGMQISTFFGDAPSRLRACRSGNAADEKACASGAGLMAASMPVTAP